MSKPTVIRFWIYSITAGHPVLIKIAAGQTLRHSETIDYLGHKETYHRAWTFDGEVLSLRVVYEGTRERLCGPITNVECAVQDVRGGQLLNGVEWPAWRRSSANVRQRAAS